MTTPPCSPRIAVYPGSFDPITLGHLNVMERASRLFDRLIVGVGVNIEKETLFTPEERQRADPRGHGRICRTSRSAPSPAWPWRLSSSAGRRSWSAACGPITDIAAELTMMMANRRLAPDVETLFMIADGELAHVSSSLIKQIASVASDEELARFLPPKRGCLPSRCRLRMRQGDRPLGQAARAVPQL